MNKKLPPFTKETISKLAEKFPTPFYIYDEAAILDNARKIKEAFSWNPGFREFFAVKATPNPYIIKLLASAGFGCDASSLVELMLSEKSGVTGERVMFSSNDTTAEEFRLARRIGAIINLDDISHIDFLEHEAGIPELICCRFNPGSAKEGNDIIGKPEAAKYGFMREQMFEGYAKLKAKGAKRFGLHTMVASNELNPRYFAETARLLFGLAAEVSRKLGISFEFVNIGGGIGIPYRPEQNPVDINEVSNGVRKAYADYIADGFAPLNVFMECGRVITGPYGYLVSKTLHVKKTFRDYAGLDACMANLMRPAMYGAYHHITVLGKENADTDHIYDVTGSLCENNDKFAIQRALPEIVPGDFVVIHDAGAHGHAMGFNYNGKTRSAELMMRADGSFLQIRRAETPADIFATLDFDGLAGFPK